MKKINKNLKSFIAGLFMLMAVVLISVPSVGFAKDNGKEKNNQDYKSAWNRFFDFFGYRANAATDTRVSKLTPVISGITSPTLLEVGEIGTWTVKASDPQNKSLSYDVDWGDSTSKSLSRIAENAFVQTSTFTHAYDKEGEYKIKFTVSNENGLKTVSTVTVHVGDDDDTDEEDGPSINDLAVKSLKPRQATVSWTTDTRATSSVWYSKTSPVDTSKLPTIFRPAKIWNHKKNLSRLEPNTKYYVVVGSSDKNGMTKSSEISFTTKALTNNTTTPVITELNGSSVVVSGENTTVTIKAYDPNNGTLSYSADWGDNSVAMTPLRATSEPLVQNTTFSHVYEKSGTYTATFTVQNEAGYKTSSSMKIRVVDISTNNS